MITDNSRSAAVSCVELGPARASRERLPGHPHWGDTSTGSWLDLGNKKLLYLRSGLTWRWFEAHGKDDCCTLGKLRLPRGESAYLNPQNQRDPVKSS